jgi:hypothetical protein
LVTSGSTMTPAAIHFRMDVSTHNGEARIEHRLYPAGAR